MTYGGMELVISTGATQEMFTIFALYPKIPMERYDDYLGTIDDGVHCFSIKQDESSQ